MAKSLFISLFSFWTYYIRKEYRKVSHDKCHISQSFIIRMSQVMSHDKATQ